MRYIRLFMFIIVLIIFMYIVPYYSAVSPEIISITPSKILQEPPIDEEVKVSIEGKNLNASTQIFINNKEITDKEIDGNIITFVLQNPLYKKTTKNKVQLKNVYSKFITKASKISTISVIDKSSIPVPYITDVDTTDFNMSNSVITLNCNNFVDTSRVFVNGNAIHGVTYSDMGVKIEIPFKTWSLMDKLSIYVEQTYNAQLTDVKSNIYVIEIPSLRNANRQLYYNWLNSGYLIAHAFGGIDGVTYTNSLEAFLSNYSNGHKLFEVDLQFTSDDLLVARHDWEATRYNDVKGNVPNEMKNNLPHTFNDIKTYSQFTQISFDDICYLMKDYKDMYIVTDTKEKNFAAVKKTFDYIQQRANEIDHGILSRIIVQTYDQSMYYQMINSYDFTSYIYTLYNSPDNNQQVLDFIRETGIKVVTMPVGRDTPEFVDSLLDMGCYTFTHTLNSIDEVYSLWERNGYGVYTDFLTYDSFICLPHERMSILEDNWYLNSTQDISEYLERLRNNNYICVITAQDEASYSLNEEIINNLKKLGLQASVAGLFRHSYIAIINSGEVIIEKASPEPIPYNSVIDGVPISAYSAGYDAGSMTYTYISNRDYSVHGRGLNFVIYDKRMDEVVSSVCFDTFEGLSYSKKPIRYDKSKDNLKENYMYFVRYLKDICNDEYIVMLSVNDEGLYNINDELQGLFEQIGIKKDIRGKMRYSYGCIIDGRNSLFENLSENTPVETEMVIGQWKCSIKSAGLNTGSAYSSLMINDVEYSKNRRGINIVVFDKVLEKVISSVNFDTFDAYMRY